MTAGVLGDWSWESIWFDPPSDVSHPLPPGKKIGMRMMRITSRVDRIGQKSVSIPQESMCGDHFDGEWAK